FFNTPHAFVKGSSVPGYAAQPMASYTSYAQFAYDLSHGAFPTGVAWVMYGIESTTDSPVAEKEHPSEYLKKFATLAHAHHLKVMEVPGRDLVFVPSADCKAKPGENIDAAYLRCRIPAAASAADIFLVQAQGDQ